MNFHSNLILQYRNAYVNTDNMRRLLRDAMLLRYIIGIAALVITYRYRSQMPFPYPYSWYGSALFVSANAVLHLFSLKKSFLKKAFILLPYFDVGFAPVILGTTGGFMSPFLLTHFLTAVGSGILYTSNRHLAFHSFIILLSSYLGIAFLQKFGIIGNNPVYTEVVLHNNIFFFFVISVTSLILSGGYILVKLMNAHIHETLDDLTRSFDNIVKGTTYTVGKDFFANLARHLSETFNVRSILIGRADLQKQQFSAVTFWLDGTPQKNYTCALPESLASEIIGNPEKRVFDNTSDRSTFSDPVISLFSVRFLFGIPLQDSNGRIIGVLLVLNDTPLRTLHLLDPILSIFASRAAAEIERGLAEEKRSHVELQLAQMHKMEAIGQLAGGIAHDFNNTIGAINGYAALLKSKLGTGHPHITYIDKIMTAGKNASAIVDQLAQFVRNDKPGRHPIDAHTVIGRAISMLRMMEFRDIAIRHDFKADHAIISGDETLLQNVLVNLGVNARDACGETGGTLTITTANIELTPESSVCQTFSLPPGPSLCITVQDNGSGMSNEVLKRCFDPFFTTKSKGKGTGLGCANVWRYIENYRGAVEVTSETKIGTTFQLYFSLYSSRTPPKAAISDTSSVPVHSILLADDEESIREIFSEILTNNGYIVHTCTDGHEAVDYIDSTATPVDLVILDMVMPQMNGPETFLAIRSRYPAMKILLISGIKNSNDVDSLLAEPATAFLSKPCTSAQLLAHIRALSGLPPMVD